MSTKHTPGLKRLFTAPADAQRCRYDITLRGDKSRARCMRAAVDGGDLCQQHAKIVGRFQCTYCGGNDELPPDHCMDCERPGNASVCGNCGGLGYRREANGEPIPCDLCDDAIDKAAGSAS